MPKSDAQKLAQAKYDQKSYDQILIKVRKGKREEYQSAAAKLGLGQMELFRKAAEEFIQNHAGEALPRLPAPMSEQPRQKLSKEDEQLLNLPTEAKKHLLKFLDSLKQQDNSKGGGDND